MKKDSVSPFKITWGVTATLLVTLLSLAIALQHFADLRNADAWNVHSYKVLRDTDHMLRGVLNIQNAVRGYFLTGRAELLEPLALGHEEFIKSHDHALSMTRNDQAQQRRLSLLREQFDLWMNHAIQPLIKVRRSSPDVVKALKIVMPGQKQRRGMIDSLRKTLSQVERHELILLQQRTERENSQQLLAQTALLTNGAFAIVLAAVFCAAFSIKSQRLQSSNLYLSEQITAREKAEREARALSLHNEMLLRASRDGLVSLNQAGRITALNPAAEAITGWSEREVLGKPISTLLCSRRSDGSLYPAEECPIAKTLCSGLTHSSPDDIIWHKNGAAIPVDYSCIPLGPEHNVYWEGGNTRAVGALVCFQDITERKKSSRALQELAALVRYSDDAIISIDLYGVITHWNKGATDLYGYKEWEIVGEYIDRLIPSENSEELTRLLCKVRREEHVNRVETNWMHQEGTLVRVVLSISPIKDEQGQVIGASTISRDVYGAYIQRMHQHDFNAADPTFHHEVLLDTLV